MAAAVPTHVHCQTRAWGLFARGALPLLRRVSPCGRQFPTNAGENIEERRLELIKSFLAAAAALRRARSPPRKRRYKMGGIVWELDPRFAPADGESKSAPGPRLGTLTTTPWDHPAPCSVPTPIALTYTRRGEPAHLTPDNVDELPREARSFHVSLAHFLDHLGPDHVGNHPGGGRRYFGSRPTCMLVTARDPLTFDQDAKPSNTDAHTFVASPTGTTKITTDDYARWIAAIQPDAFVALADESPCWEQGVAMKKTKQATARTAKWLGELLEKTKDLPTAPSVFASVQGGSDAGERRACSEDIVERFGASVSGYSVGSLGAGETPGTHRRSLLHASIEPLPVDKPRYLAGLACGPLDVLDAIEMGVDMVDSSFCHQCTTQGYALTFPLKPPNSSTSDDSEEETKGKGKRKRTAVDEKDAGKDRDAPYVEEDAARRLLTGGDAFKTNLWALAYRADKRPLLPGCQCLACTRYMRAYVHHLLQCHEMTAAVLLDVHNYYHFNRFMEAAREAIGDGTWKEFAEFHRERAARLDGDD